MADIRINALATTAASTASDDFIAVDGSANGTRKLNAYSPTFGGNVAAIGNLTVSGAINVGGNVLGTSTGNDEWKILRGSDTNYSLLTFRDTAGNNEWVIGRRVDSVAGAGNFSFYSTSLGANALTLALVSGNATLAGNLTVSGTGLSSFAGSLGIGTTSPTRPLDVRGSLGMQVNEDNAGTKVISIRSDFAGAGPAINVTTNDPLLFLTNNSERARITSGGNVLIGTTTDSANGKLQLATHTTNAGGIGFGTDVSLYRESSVKLTANSTGSSLTLALAVGGTQKAIIASDGTTAYLGATAAGGSTILYSGNAATALTLDSSQNATFAKNVTIGSGVAASTLTIGTSTSSATVNVVAATDNTARINLDETAATNGAFWQYVGSTNTIQIGSRVSSTDTVAISFARASANVTVAGNLNVTGTQNILGLPATADALGSNSTMTFELTSNTSLTIKVRGTDGTTRSVALTLA